MIPEYISYRPPYLEAFAVKMMQRHGRYLSSDKLAVDIELMLELQGYHVSPVVDLPHHVEAFLARDLKTVYVREYEDNTTRPRASLAEEQAHIFLHLPDLLGSGGDPCDLGAC